MSNIGSDPAELHHDCQDLYLTLYILAKDTEISVVNFKQEVICDLHHIFLAEI